MKRELILILIQNLGGGGAEKVTINLATYLKDKGYLVKLVLLEETGAFLNTLPTGIEIINLKVNRFRNSIFPMVSCFNMFKPKIILVNMWPLTFFATISWLISRRLGKLFLVEHTNLLRAHNGLNTISKFFFKISCRITYPFATGVVAVSKGVFKEIIEISKLKKEKVKVINNPIFRNNIPNSIGFYEIPDFWKNCKYRILSVGRFGAEKNHKMLLNSFAILRRHLDAKLIILGDGPLYSSTKDYVLNLGMSDSVYLPGFVLNLDSFYYYSDLFVLSSNNEGFGNVIVEALSHGVQVVCTDCPSGPSEILSNGKYGTLVPVNDCEIMAGAMLKSLLNPTDREFLKGRARDFSIDKMSEKYLDMFLNF
jgi:glycosyltransferase involved in cell wall biosynthesis